MTALSPVALILPKRTKPSMRGWSHLFAFFGWLVMGAVAIVLAPPGTPTFATAVHAASLAALLGISGLYHTPMWTPKPRLWLKRLDHAAIFLLIAGTYTPICLLALPPELGEPLLRWIWLGAVVGVVQSMVWPGAPRMLTVVFYLAFSWALVSQWSAVTAALPSQALWLLGVGGVLYSLGALVYGKRWPDPNPKTFGYHEIFHACVVVAAGLHAIAVAGLVHHIF